MTRFLRGSFVIARRDFNATVLSKTFIFFLIGPLFPLLLGGVFGGIGASVATQTGQSVVAVVSTDAEFARLSTARQQLSATIPTGAVVALAHYRPEPNPVAQQQHLLASRHPSIGAVLFGGLEHPHVVGPSAADEATTAQLRLLIAQARTKEPPLQVVQVTSAQPSSGGSLEKDRQQTGLYAQMLLFFLTILLSGMVLSQLIEEKSNKIIEVIAAAVPIDAMFVGKLFAMLAASVVGIVVWITLGALLVNSLKAGGVHALPPPAVGWPVFLLLSVVYFGMNYLLLGAAFLTIGAQASTAREVQTMSMPVTFAQVLIFGFAATSMADLGSGRALAAAVFPLSSPMTMLARAAQDPRLWPQFVAIAWQATWVALILRIGAHLFRKTVLKSGPRTRWWKRARA